MSVYNNYPGHSRDNGSRQEGPLRGISAYHHKPAPPPPIISYEGKRRWDNQYRQEREHNYSPYKQHSVISPQRSPENEPPHRSPFDNRKRIREDHSPILTQDECTRADGIESSSEMNGDNDASIFATSEGVVELRNMMDSHKKETMKREGDLHAKILEALSVSADKMTQLEKEKQTLANKNADLKTSLEEVEKIKNDLNVQIEQIKSDMAFRLKQRDAIEAELRDKNISQASEINSVKKERDELNLIVENLEVRSKEDENEIQELKRKLSISEQENVNLRKYKSENEKKLLAEVKKYREALQQKTQELIEETSAKTQLEANFEKLTKENLQVKTSFMAQQKESADLKEKLRQVEQKCGEVSISLKEESRKLQQAREMCDKLTQEKSTLDATVLAHQNEIKKHKSDIKSLNGTVDNLNLQLQQREEQAESAMEDVFKGFMEKVDQQESSTKREYENWCHTFKLDRSLNGSSLSERQSSREKTETPRSGSSIGRQGVKQKELNRVKRPLQKSVRPNNKNAMIIFQQLCETIRRGEIKRKKIRSTMPKKAFPTHTTSNATQLQNASPELMEEVQEPPVITSPTSSAEMGILKDSSEGMNNNKSPTSRESQTMVSDKTTSSSSAKSKLSPQSTAIKLTPIVPMDCGTTASENSTDKLGTLLPKLLPNALRSSNSSQHQPIPAFTSSRQPPVRSREYTTPSKEAASSASMCKWCKITFSTPMLMVKHHCVNPQDPRLTPRK